MSISTRFQTLEQRTAQIESHLLPAINVTGNYSAKEIDHTRAYCLLIHAEIEAYLEDIVLEVAREAFLSWKLDNSKINSIVFHLACYQKSKIDKKESPASLIHLGIKTLEDVVSNNHGIKEHNVGSMFNPIGYTFDITLATQLNNFGKTRGDIAHRSFRTQQLLDPQTEKNEVAQLISELKKFDLDFYQNKTQVTVSLGGITTPLWKRILGMK